MVALIGPGNDQHDRHGRRDEADTAHGEAEPAGAAAAEDHRQLGGARAGEHADRAEEVEELVIVEPVAPPDRFVAQHGDMHGGAAERDRAELEHQPGHLAPAVPAVRRRAAHRRYPAAGWKSSMRLPEGSSTRI